MHFTWIGDSYELMRFRRFVFLKHKVCIIKAVRFVMKTSLPAQAKAFARQKRKFLLAEATKSKRSKLENSINTKQPNNMLTTVLYLCKIILVR